jgi:hypothetical protein
MFGFFGFVCLKGKRRRWWSFALSLLGLQFVGGSIHRSRRRLFDAFCIRSECIAHMDGDDTYSLGRHIALCVMTSKDLISLTKSIHSSSLMSFMYRRSPTLSVRSKIKSLHPGISFMMLEKKKRRNKQQQDRKN